RRRVRRGQRGAEHVRRGAVLDVVLEAARAGDEAAGGGDRLGERARQDVDVTRVDVLRLAHATAGLPDRADRVRLVDEQERAVLPLERDDVRDRRLVTVHAEHGVDRDQDATGATILRLAQPPLEI